MITTNEGARGSDDDTSEGDNAIDLPAPALVRPVPILL